MRVGRVAEIAGVTVRTVRHYHRMGVLPEPPRDANGYRRYGLRDAVLLVRARRLVALGLTLEDVARVLADERGQGLRELVAEVDRDLARQESEIRATRRRIAELLATESGTIGAAEGIGAFEALAETMVEGADLARLDAELLLLLPSTGAGAEMRSLLPTITTEADAERLRSIYRDLDAVAGRPVDAPEVEVIANRIHELLGPEVRGRLRAALATGDDAPDLVDAIGASLAPAQLAVVLRVVDRVRSGD